MQCNAFASTRQSCSKGGIGQMETYGRVFARIYNQLWAGFANYVAPRIRDYYEEQMVSEDHKTLLDVACGTGQLMTHFLEKGYNCRLITLFR